MRGRDFVQVLLWVNFFDLLRYSFLKLFFLLKSSSSLDKADIVDTGIDDRSFWHQRRARQCIDDITWLRCNHGAKFFNVERLISYLQGVVEPVGCFRRFTHLHVVHVDTLADGFH